MASTKAIREARARVRELDGIIAAGAAAKKERAAQAAPLKKRKATRLAALAKVHVITSAAAHPQVNLYHSTGDPRLETLASIHPQAGRAQKPAALAESLAKGETKVTIGGSGQVYGLPGMLQRTRLVAPADEKRIVAAEKVVARRRTALSQAYAELKAANEAAFANGTKVDRKAIADQLSRVHSIDDDDRLGWDDPRVAAADQASRSRTVAVTHLNWLTLDGDGWAKEYAEAQFMPKERPDECPCQACQSKVAEAAGRAARDARLAALPTAMKPCPIHGRHRVSLDFGQSSQSNWTVERRAEIVAKEPGLDAFLPAAPRGYYESPITDIPVAWCLRDRKAGPTQMILTADWLATLRKAAGKTKKVKTPLEWICPNPECGETSAYPLGESTVECPACGAQFDADVVKTMKPERKVA